MRCLMITLYAPLTSYGESGAARVRLSWTRPGRSAVLGMIGAALGVDWASLQGHAALSDGLGYAVRSDAIGSPMIDYQTAHVGEGAAARNARTRREELAGETAIVVTRREYRTDALHTVGLWVRPGCRWTLEELAEAVQRPRWALSIGRKSNVPALPLNPRIVEAETLAACFALSPALPSDIAAEMLTTWGMRLDEQPHIATDADAPGLSTIRIEQRRDLYGYGRNFRERTEHIMESD